MNEKVREVIAALESPRYGIIYVESCGMIRYAGFDNELKVFVSTLFDDKEHVETLVADWNFFGGPQWTPEQIDVLQK